MQYRDRADAGRRLARALAPLAREAPMVVALPRGGVPVAYEIARALRAPLDVWGARKLGAPSQPELGLGAIAEGGALYVDRRLAARLDVNDDEIELIAAREQRELERRVRRFRPGRARLDVSGRTVVVVDDGVATGGTARAAIRGLRAAGASRIVLAVPVGALETVEALRAEADVVVCPVAADDLYAVGAWYRDFHQVEDDEVLDLLSRAAANEDGARGAADGDR